VVIVLANEYAVEFGFSRNFLLSSSTASLRAFFFGSPILHPILLPNQGNAGSRRPAIGCRGPTRRRGDDPGLSGWSALTREVHSRTQSPEFDSLRASPLPCHKLGGPLPRRAGSSPKLFWGRVYDQ
jgi:hypothetical protein